MKKIEYIPQTPSTKSDIDSERKSYTKPFNFSQYFESKENNENNSGRKSCNKINTEDEQTKEKLENIRNNISNIRNKVSSYSKIYDNISTQIESGITNVPIDEKLKIQNNKIQQQLIESYEDNKKLKNRIFELENELEKVNKNMMIQYKKKFLDEMKELQKIFEETIENKNKEINRLNQNQEFLVQQMEALKLTFNKEKNQLRKYNEELLNKNFELQKQLSNFFYSNNNNQNFQMSNFTIMKNQMLKRTKRRKSDELNYNLSPLTDEDKSISFSFKNNNDSNNKSVIVENQNENKENLKNLDINIQSYQNSKRVYSKLG
jgi:hypothetical protein